jgi:hypothetical protein
MLCVAVLLKFHDEPGIEAASGNKRGLLKGEFEFFGLLRLKVVFVLRAVLQI